MKTSSFVWMTDNRQRSRTLNTHKLYHGFLNKAFLYNFIFQTLLQQGHSDANAIGRNSYTPLHLAAEMDNEKICQILVRRFLRECHIPFFFWPIRLRSTQILVYLSFWCERRNVQHVGSAGQRKNLMSPGRDSDPSMTSAIPVGGSNHRATSFPLLFPLPAPSKFQGKSPGNDVEHWAFNV